METNPVHCAEPIAARSRGGYSTGPSLPTPTFAWLTACLLILLGAAFELGMLGFGPYNSSGILLLSVVGKNAWTVLTDLACPELSALAKIWPLMLILFGVSILFVVQPRNRFESVAVSSGEKENRVN